MDPVAHLPRIMQVIEIKLRFGTCQSLRAQPGSRNVRFAMRPIDKSWLIVIERKHAHECSLGVFDEPLHRHMTCVERGRKLYIHDYFI